MNKIPTRTIAQAAKTRLKRGTVFQNRVWCALNKIPKGKVTTYGLLAKYLKTNAVRAVGTAVGKSPNAPTCPCHRVVRSDGAIGNYSGRGGVKRKIQLLAKEGVQITDNTVDLTRYGVSLTQLA